MKDEEQVREVLGCRESESTIDVARRRVDRLRELSAQIDERDQQIAVALDGLMPGMSDHEAVRAIVKLVRELQQENFALKKELGR